MDEYAIISYVTKQGLVPFDEWYDGLDNQAAQRVYEALTRMEEGNLWAGVSWNGESTTAPVTGFILAWTATGS